jgi:hypothetical protein
MPVQPGPLLVLWHNAIERITHVGADIVVVVFIQRQRARRVLDEQRQQARLVLLELRQLARDDVGDEVRAARARGERELFLEPARSCLSVCCGLEGGEEKQRRGGGVGGPRHCWR